MGFPFMAENFMDYPRPVLDCMVDALISDQQEGQMKGSAEHNVWVAQAGEIDANSPSHAGGPFAHLRTDRVTVIVANNDDSNYWQGFENWEELRAFIRRLEDAGNKAFSGEADKRETVARDVS